MGVVGMDRSSARRALSRDFSAFELLLRPEVDYDDLLEIAGQPDWSQVDDRLPAQVRTQMEVRAKYSGYN